MTVPQVSTEDAHVAEWEAILEREGLGAVDPVNTMVRPQVVRSSGADASTDAADRYLAWARDVLERCPFSVVRGDADHPIPAPGTRRWVWAMHADGVSINNTASELGISRRAVKTSIRLTRAEAAAFLNSTPPVANPWLKSRLCRRRAEDKIKEESVAKAEVVEYALIELRRDFRIPGHPAVKNRLVPMKWHDGKIHPLRGIPHAGGIDIEFPTVHVGRKTTTVITVVWPDIAGAQREPEDWIGDAA